MVVKVNRLECTFLGWVGGFIATVAMFSACAVRIVPGPEDEKPVTPGVEAAAYEAARTYILGLASAARATADKADEFKANSEVWDFQKPLNAAAHSTAFDALAAAEDAAVKPDAAYDAKAVRQMFLDEAAGYERAVR